MVLKVYLNGLSNVLMFLASLQKPLTSDIQKRLPDVPGGLGLNLTSESTGMFSCERQQLDHSSLQASVLYLTVTARFTYSYFIYVVLLCMYHFQNILYLFSFIPYYLHLYTVSSFGHWPTALCLYNHIFHLVWSGTLNHQKPPTPTHPSPCCLLKVLLITSHFVYAECGKGSLVHECYNELPELPFLLCPFITCLLC